MKLGLAPSVHTLFQISQPTTPSRPPLRTPLRPLCPVRPALAPTPTLVATRFPGAPQQIQFRAWPPTTCTRTVRTSIPPPLPLCPSAARAAAPTAMWYEPPIGPATPPPLPTPVPPTWIPRLLLLETA